MDCPDRRDSSKIVSGRNRFSSLATPVIMWDRQSEVMVFLVMMESRRVITPAPFGLMFSPVQEAGRQAHINRHLLFRHVVSRYRRRMYQCVLPLVRLLQFRKGPQSVHLSRFTGYFLLG